MSIEIATGIAQGIYGYLALGVVVALWLQLGGLKRIDATAAQGPRGFRLLITPGLVLLWPFLLRAALAGRGHPRTERNAHRCASHGEEAS